MALPQGSYKKINDSVYLDSDLYDRPKEYFKLLSKIMLDKYGKDPISLIDVGCASGAFIHYIKANLNIVDGVGIDISEKLIKAARQKLPDVEFHTNSIDSLPVDFGRTFDVCTCLGTLGIFDEIERPINNLLGFLKKEGSLFIFNIFNEDPVDVIMRYRFVKDEEDAQWESGLNVLSMVTIERFLKRYSSDIEIEWVDFELPFHLPKQDNPMRQWTMGTDQRKHQIVVGTGQMLDQKILRVIKR
jgi:SAM-dependent methyltransferase